MIQAIIINNLEKNTYNFDENMTLREALESKGIDPSVGVVSLDYSPVRPGGLDKTFAEHGITVKCSLSVTAKADNAAPSIKIIARSAVLESGCSLEDIKLVAAKRPKVLELYDDKEKLVYSACVSSKGDGSANEIGVSFAPVAAINGKAMMTKKIPDGISADQVKDWAAEEFGAAVTYLAKIEAKIPNAVTEIKADIAKVKEVITVA